MGWLQRSRTYFSASAVAVAAVLATASVAVAQEPQGLEPAYNLGALSEFTIDVPRAESTPAFASISDELPPVVFRLHDHQVTPAQFQPLLPPSQLLQPRIGTTSTPSVLSGSLFSRLGSGGDANSDERPGATGPQTAVSGREAKMRVSSDAGSLLRLSPSALGVEAPHRNPIVTDTRVRGNRFGALLASGSYWVPARLDLDTMLSKIDAQVVEEVTVIKGPYSAMFGPGFDFLDLELLRSPRYERAFEMHGSTAADYRLNGQQFSGRQSFWGGDEDWGFRVGYGHRTGNDYDSGADVSIPASYNSRDLHVNLGADLVPGHQVEVNFLRLDQTNVEYPGQAFDMDFLVTDGVEVSYGVEDNERFDSFMLESWYNRTRLEGNAQNESKRRQFPFYDLLGPDGTAFTDVDSMSVGYRAAVTWSDSQHDRLTVGSDLRYIKQELNELLSGIILPIQFQDRNSPIPRSHASNPGLFAEYRRLISDRTAFTTGGRVDWVSANLEESLDNLQAIGTTLQRPYDEIVGTRDFDRDYTLHLMFASVEHTLNCCWTASLSAGYAERAPNLTELYAAGPFMFVLQNGLNTVTGDPTLAEEEMWQIDAGLSFQDTRLRARVNGFYSWIRNRITYEGKTAPFVPFVQQVQLRFVNADRATLAGVEFAATYDLSSMTQAYSTLSYVEGNNEEINEPLPSIAPLTSRVGLRLHQASDAPMWSAEVSARLTASQERLATGLFEQPTPGFVVWDVRGNRRVSDRLSLIAGIENVTDRNYQEYLDYHSPNETFSLPTLQPGRTFYFGSELLY